MTRDARIYFASALVPVGVLFLIVGGTLACGAALADSPLKDRVLLTLAAVVLFGSGLGAFVAGVLVHPPKTPVDPRALILAIPATYRPQVDWMCRMLETLTPGEVVDRSLTLHYLMLQVVVLSDLRFWVARAGGGTSVPFDFTTDLAALARGINAAFEPGAADLLTEDESDHDPDHGPDPSVP